MMSQQVLEWIGHSITLPTHLHGVRFRDLGRPFKGSRRKLSASTAPAPAPAQWPSFTFSEQTIKVLRVCAKINPGLWFRTGREIRSFASDKTELVD
jgi:hypothetical protein